jgi:predicted SprT family Zn-dependent metalloprotease
MNREEALARRAFLEAKYAGKAKAVAVIVLDENAAPAEGVLPPASSVGCAATASSATPAAARRTVDDDDSPVTLGALLEASASKAKQPLVASSTPVAAAIDHSRSSRKKGTTGRRLRRMCLSPVHDDGGVSCEGEGQGEGEGTVTSGGSRSLFPLESSSVDWPAEESSVVSLATLKASFSARKEPNLSQSNVERESMPPPDCEEDLNEYDYGDGWLVEDEEEDEEEESDDESADGCDSGGESEEAEAADDSASETSATSSESEASSAAESLDSHAVDAAPAPAPRIDSRSTAKSATLKAAVKLVAVDHLKDGAVDPSSGKIFIREESSLPPLSGRPGARHAFRSRAARDALTLALYDEYNASVFGGRLPPAALPALQARTGSCREAAAAAAAAAAAGASLPLEWRGRLVKTAGLTFTKTAASGARCARVALSVKVLDSPARLASTLLHELCHAAAWLIDGVNRPPHGRVFYAWGNRASAAYPRRAVTTCHNYHIVAKYTYACDGCGARVGRHSKVDASTAAPACRVCQLGTLHLIASSSNAPSSLHAAATPRTVSAYQQFTNAHRASVRADLGGRSADPRAVMAELARRWGEAKKEKVAGGVAAEDPRVIDLTDALAAL